MGGRRGRSEDEADEIQPALANEAESGRAPSFETFLREEFPFRDVPDLEIQFKLFYAANRGAYRNNFQEALAAWEKSLTGQEVV